MKTQPCTPEKLGHSGRLDPVTMQMMQKYGMTPEKAPNAHVKPNITHNGGVFNCIIPASTASLSSRSSSLDEECGLRVKRDGSHLNSTSFSSTAISNDVHSNPTQMLRKFNLSIDEDHSSTATEKITNHGCRESPNSFSIASYQHAPTFQEKLKARLGNSGRYFKPIVSESSDKSQTVSEEDQLTVEFQDVGSNEEASHLTGFASLHIGVPVNDEDNDTDNIERFAISEKSQQDCVSNKQDMAAPERKAQDAIKSEEKGAQHDIDKSPKKTILDIVHDLSPSPSEEEVKFAVLRKDIKPDREISTQLLIDDLQAAISKNENTQPIIDELHSVLSKRFDGEAQCTRNKGQDQTYQLQRTRALSKESSVSNESQSSQTKSSNVMEQKSTLSCDETEFKRMTNLTSSYQNSTSYQKYSESKMKLKVSAVPMSGIGVDLNKDYSDRAKVSTPREAAGVSCTLFGGLFGSLIGMRSGKNINALELITNICSPLPEKLESPTVECFESAEEQRVDHETISVEINNESDSGTCLTLETYEQQENENASYRSSVESASSESEDDTTIIDDHTIESTSTLTHSKINSLYSGNALKGYHRGPMGSKRVYKPQNTERNVQGQRYRTPTNEFDDDGTYMSMSTIRDDGTMASVSTVTYSHVDAGSLYSNAISGYPRGSRGGYYNRVDEQGANYDDDNEWETCSRLTTSTFGIGTKPYRPQDYTANKAYNRRLSRFEILMECSQSGSRESTDAYDDNDDHDTAYTDSKSSSIRGFM